ncbi:MAG: chemotaxis protein CheW [Planctomycetota bacterium]|nr:chemotaxis protein CheW [Planctomycetota bacterium]
MVRGGQLVYLNKELRTEGGGKPKDGAINIVVLQADERQFGLVVDEINDTEEIVVKPLGKLFKGLTTFAGATIMGDGRVALILDVMGLAQKANVISEGKDRLSRESGSAGKDGGTAKQTLLLFRISGSRRMAIPLSLVARLEEFPADMIELSGDQQVVQYRGQIMPLVSLANALRGESAATAARNTEAEAEAGQTMQVIVYTAGGRSVGLLVDRIVDVVEEAIAVQRTNVARGVLGSAVIENKVTEMLDVEGLIRDILPDSIATSAVKAA